MPTDLPVRRLDTRVPAKRNWLTTALNAFMLISGILLFFAVLAQEERYASGRPGYLAPTSDAVLPPAAAEPENTPLWETLMLGP